MQLIKDAGKLARAITQHGTKSTKIKTERQLLLLSCVLNAMIAGNADMVNKLLDVVDYAKSSMTKWSVSMGFFTHVAKSKTRPAHLVVNMDKRSQFVTDDKLKDEPRFVQMLVGLKPFWEFDPPKEYEPYVLLKKLKAVKAQAASYKQGDKAKLNNNFAGEKELDALIAALEVAKPANQLAA